MDNPYRPDPTALRARTQQAEEEKVITLKDDSTKPPPTIGAPSWQNILAGPMLSQPSSDTHTFEHSAQKMSLIVKIGLILIGLFIIYIIFKQLSPF
jgi:hypothetical protein